MSFKKAFEEKTALRFVERRKRAERGLQAKFTN